MLTQHHTDVQASPRECDAPGQECGVAHEAFRAVVPDGGHGEHPANLRDASGRAGVHASAAQSHTSSAERPPHTAPAAVRALDFRCRSVVTTTSSSALVRPFCAFASAPAARRLSSSSRQGGLRSVNLACNASLRQLHLEALEEQVRIVAVCVRGLRALHPHAQPGAQ